MEKSNFALRLLPSLRTAAQRIAERENCSVNQLINLALAEKIAVLDAEYWEQRKRAAKNQPGKNVLERLAGNEPPREGDELPKDATTKRHARKAKVPAGARRHA